MGLVVNHLFISFMKKKLSQLITLFMFLFLSISVNAQNTMQSPTYRATKLTEWMKKDLQLTDGQASKIQDINLKYANKTEEVKNSTVGKRQKIQTLKNNERAKDAELKQVLNETQYKTYVNKKNELKEKVKEEERIRKEGY